MISTLMSLKYDEHWGLELLKDDEHQKNAIGEAGKGIHFAVSIREPGAGRPFAHDRSAEAHHKCQAVEKHVNAIAQQTQGSSHYSIECLNDHENEVKTLLAVSSERSPKTF